MEKVRTAARLAEIQELWTPHIVGVLNGQHVKLVKLKGEFIWHLHEGADELFYVLHGRLIIRLRDRDIVLEPGEFCIVPKGVEHLPVAEDEVHVMLFEPAGTVNTGNIVNERTVHSPKSL